MCLYSVGLYMTMQPVVTSNTVVFAFRVSASVSCCFKVAVLLYSWALHLGQHALSLLTGGIVVEASPETPEGEIEFKPGGPMNAPHRSAHYEPQHMHLC